MTNEEVMCLTTLLLIVSQVRPNQLQRRSLIASHTRKEGSGDFR